MSIYNKGTLKAWLEKWGLAALILLTLSSLSVSSQENRANRRVRRNEDTEALVKDSAAPVLTDSMIAVRDSISRADSIHRADSMALMEKSSLDAPAFTAARDSIIEDFSDGKQMIYYYGEVTVTYGNMKMTADYMEYDLKTGILYARGTTDTTGTTVGKPVMEQGGKSYTMDEVRYNFNTQKARITNMVTQEQDGILHGKNIKMMPDRSINITH